MAENKELAKRVKAATALDVQKAAFDMGNEDSASFALAALEEMPEDNFITLTGEYLEFEVNKTYNVVVLQLTTMKDPKPKEGQEARDIPVVQFVMKGTDGKPANFISGAAVLVSTVKKIAETREKVNGSVHGAALRIKTGDKVAAAAGKYISMEIKQLFAMVPEPVTQS